MEVPISIAPKIESTWLEPMKEAFRAESFLHLKQFLLEERKKYEVYPPGPFIFSAFNQCPFDKIKVVIIGQDPYHGVGQANGLCFSVNPGVKLPPSLVNIYKEIEKDLECKMSSGGDLSKWASQGVLLLNATLTVRAHAPASHQGKGWEIFTDEVIRNVSAHHKGLVFLLWGKPAQQKEKLIDSSKHFILKAPHPSPLSAYTGFFGCRHFSGTNKILLSQGKVPINWQIS